MRHDRGLAASPLVRYMLKVEGCGRPLAGVVSHGVKASNVRCSASTGTVAGGFVVNGCHLSLRVRLEYERDRNLITRVRNLTNHTLDS